MTISLIRRQYYLRTEAFCANRIGAPTWKKIRKIKFLIVGTESLVCIAWRRVHRCANIQYWRRSITTYNLHYNAFSLNIHLPSVISVSHHIYIHLPHISLSLTILVSHIVSISISFPNLGEAHRTFRCASPIDTKIAFWYCWSKWNWKDYKQKTTSTS